MADVPLFPDTCVIIPTYNEAETIGAIVGLLLGPCGFPRVLVVDESPNEKTMAAATEAGAHVFRPQGRTGLGRSIIRGFGITGPDPKGYTHAIVMDAGGSHDPADAVKMATAVRAYRKSIELEPWGPPIYDHLWVLIGSRFRPGGSADPGRKRHIMSIVAARLFSLAMGVHVSDATSGFRCYRLDAVKDALASRMVKARGHAFQMDLLGSLMLHGANVLEIPIKYVAGKSSFRWWMCWEALGVLWRLYRERRRLEKSGQFIRPILWGRNTED